jgi:hypothetical protein
MAALRIRKKQRKNRCFFEFCGRGERIRTSDTYVPNVVLYQAELHPDTAASAVSTDREGEQFYQRIAEL